MKEFLNNKLLFILFLFIILTITLFGNVFASSSYVFSDGETYDFPDFTLDDNCNYILYINSGTNTFHVLMYSKEYNLKGVKDSAGDIWLYLYDVNGNRVPSSSMFLHGLIFSDNGNLSTDTTYNSIFINGENVYYTNVPVYNTDGDLVFQVAPVTVELEMKQVEEILPKMWEIATLIIPVCLIVFGTLLIVYLIKSKNLLHL